MYQCPVIASITDVILSAKSIFQGNRSGHACMTVNACTNALSMHSSLLSCSLPSPFSRATGQFMQKNKRNERKDKTTPFGLNFIRSQVLYQAAHRGQVMHVSQSMPCQCIHHCCHVICQVQLPGQQVRPCMYQTQCPVNECVTAVVLAAKSIFQSLPTGHIVQMPC